MCGNSNKPDVFLLLELKNTFNCQKKKIDRYRDLMKEKITYPSMEIKKRDIPKHSFRQNSYMSKNTEQEFPTGKPHLLIGKKLF